MGEKEGGMTAYMTAADNWTVLAVVIGLLLLAKIAVEVTARNRPKE